MLAIMATHYRSTPANGTNGDGGVMVAAAMSSDFIRRVASRVRGVAR